MVNKWINHVKRFADENNIKYNQALKDVKCKQLYKTNRDHYGGGIMDDGLNYIKNEGKKMIKKGAKNLVDKGADLIKNQMIGDGIFGDIGKSISGFALDKLPVPDVIKDVGKLGTNYLIDKSGLGLKKKRGRKMGGALYMA